MTLSLQRKPLCLGGWCVDGPASALYPEPSCSTPVDGSSPSAPSSPPSVMSHPHNASAPKKDRQREHVGYFVLLKSNYNHNFKGCLLSLIMCVACTVLKCNLAVLILKVWIGKVHYIRENSNNQRLAGQ